MHLIQGVAGFKQLVRLAGRCFYSGQHPKPEEPKAGATARRKLDTSGLAIVILDALTRREWIEEERLAEELKVQPNVLRKTLRELERQGFLMREHRKFKDHEKAKAAAEAGEEKKPLIAKTQSLCCIDYPRVLEVLQIRIHIMRKKLKDELAEAEPLMHYKCVKCQKTYSSMDAMRLYNMMDNMFHCEDCDHTVEQAFGSRGETGDDQQRRARKETLKALQTRMEQQLKPLLEQLRELKDVDPPDYGTHADWTREQAWKEMNQKNKGKSGAGGSKDQAGGYDIRQAEQMWSDKMDVEVEMGQDAGPSVSNGGQELVENKKEMPEWMKTDADRAKAAEEAAKAAQAKELEKQEYIRQYMEAVAKRQREVSAMRTGGQDQADTEEPDRKRARTDTDIAVKAEPAEVKPEGGGAGGVPADGAALVKDDSIQWEDADVLQGANKTKTETGEDAPDGAADDDFEWEDT